MHPSWLTHGVVLFPHSTFGVSSVRVTSWSMNWPQVIVTWVKFGRMPNSSPLKPWNILLLTRLVFGRGWPVTDSLRGCSPGAYSLGRKRRSGVKAAPCLMRHRLLHVPSIVRYLCWKHRSRSLRASQPSVSLNASNVCSADIAEDAAWRNSKVAIIRIIPKRNLKTKEGRFRFTIFFSRGGLLVVVSVYLFSIHWIQYRCLQERIQALLWYKDGPNFFRTVRASKTCQE